MQKYIANQQMEDQRSRAYRLLAAKFAIALSIPLKFLNVCPEIGEVILADLCVPNAKSHL